MELFRFKNDIPFMRHALKFNMVSTTAFVLALFFLFTRGLNLSVEFTGGTFFGETAGEYHVRINLACQHERIRLAAQQLEKAIKG